jgi:hypothetical protein
MSQLLRHPLLSIGVLLFVLGAGNWVVSRNKLAEHAERIDSRSAIDTSQDLSEFPHLTPEMNAALLQRLHRGAGRYTFQAAKLDFYAVIHRGGRFLAVLGLVLIGFAVRQSWQSIRRPRPRTA